MGVVREMLDGEGLMRVREVAGRPGGMARSVHLQVRAPSPLQRARITTTNKLQIVGRYSSGPLPLDRHLPLPLYLSSYPMWCTLKWNSPSNREGAKHRIGRAVSDSAYEGFAMIRDSKSGRRDQLCYSSSMLLSDPDLGRSQDLP
jgi:hypothetical protein